MRYSGEWLEGIALGNFLGVSNRISGGSVLGFQLR